MPAAKTNRHVWRFHGATGFSALEFRCLFCDETRQRDASKVETKILKNHSKKMMAESSAIHAVWHSYLKNPLAGID